jgi:phosphatidate phosphatase APP1
MSTKLFLSIFILVLSFNSISYAVEKPFIISGFDDVLRQAENTGLLKAAIKILDEDKSFAGMPELYSAISTQESLPQFSLVSAIATWFDPRINKLLMKYQYPSNKRYLRNWLSEWSIEEFKVSKINTIISQKPNRKFIVIFDNSDASLALADELHAKFADKIQTIYLHQIEEKKLPASATKYYTAFDIAMNEYVEGRMTLGEVAKVGRAILDIQLVEKLFPSYAVCPTDHDMCPASVTEISDLCTRVKSHLQELCKKR